MHGPRYVHTRASAPSRRLPPDRAFSLFLNTTTFLFRRLVLHGDFLKSSGVATHNFSPFSAWDESDITRFHDFFSALGPDGFGGAFLSCGVLSSSLPLSPRRRLSHHGPPPLVRRIPWALRHAGTLFCGVSQFSPRRLHTSTT